MRPSRRLLLKLGLLLLAGAIVNVAIAWGCSTWPSWREWEADEQRVREAWRRSFPECQATFAVNNLIDFNGTRLEQSPGAQSFGTDIAFVHGNCPCHHNVSVLAHWSAGWPSRSLTGSSWTTDNEPYITYGILRVIAGRHLSGLPLIALWPGFAINTIFYAAILWVLFAAPFKVRRWRRIRRGLCPACGYPVGTSENCTECGNQIEQKAETQKAEIGP